MTVVLEPSTASNAEDEVHTLTDALGHFVFTAVKAGTYRFTYYSPSWLKTEAFPQIHVTAGGDVLKLEGRMAGMPDIAGRVVNGNGNGVSGALVTINGQSTKGTATTDVLGKFEAHVPPGSYGLSVAPPAGIKPPEPEPGDDQVRAWTRVYYPGVTLPEAAAKVNMHPGDQISVELKLAAVPAHVVRGKLFNPDGTGAPGVTVGLNIDEPRQGPDDQQQPTYGVKTDAEGSFEFSPVADGDLRVSAEVERGAVKLRALQWIEMAGRNIEEVKLILATPFSVQGHVVIETRKGVVAPLPPPVSLIPHAGRVKSESGAASWMLQPDRMAPAGIEARAGFRGVLFESEGAITEEPDPDGNFSFRSIYAGAYRITPQMAPPGYYLDSVRVGDTDVAAGEVQLSAGALPITVVYKAGGGAIHGTVEKCESGAVLLIPAEADRRWFGFLHSVTCDAKDQYTIAGVRPGEYYAVAFAGSDSSPAMNEVVLKQARRITVQAGETVTTDLRAISVE